MKVSLSDVEYAVLYISGQPYGENSAYLSLDTGEFYYVSGFGDSDELPEDFEESDRYLALPHLNDIDLGTRLVDRFVRDKAPHLAGHVDRIFRSRGAYRRYNSLLQSHGLLDAWREFENERSTEAIKEWCQQNGLEIGES